TSYERDVLERVHERIAAEKFDISKEIITPRVRRLWPRIGIAAAVATIIVSAGIWFYQGSQKDASVQVAVMDDVAPGHQSATLTLASGKKIVLSDAANGELAKEAGVIISKTASGQLIYEIKDENAESDKINILTTDNGETYQVRLPDGSSVWLNAASTLKYPASFAKLKDRRVELSGEGYFEVAKDKTHPFIVKTAEQEVEVLGTHFNVNAYADEKAIATTLLEGSVKVSSGEKNNKILKPGEQALNKGNTILVKEVDTENITDWKDGDFNLDQVDFRIAMRKIARWYDVEVIYDDNLSNDIQISGWISRSKKLSSVLKFIESSGLVHFKVEGRKVYVSK
ncbi:MAG: FecR family protein, partial [Pedobacter sp.]